MRLVKIEATHKGSKEKIILSIKEVTKQLKQNPILKEKYEFKKVYVEGKPIKAFVFEVWVHPINGGDDKMYTYKVPSETLKNAEIKLKGLLQKKSRVLDDYKFIQEETIYV